MMMRPFRRRGILIIDGKEDGGCGGAFVKMMSVRAAFGDCREARLPAGWRRIRPSASRRASKTSIRKPKAGEAYWRPAATFSPPPYPSSGAGAAPMAARAMALKDA